MDQNNFNNNETIVSTDYTVKNDSSCGEPMRDPQIDVLAGSGFGKALAAVIMAWFPITSIISIILGAIGLKAVNKARALAENCGVSAGGKTVAGKIMGLIGLIGGIFMTAIYLLYFIIVAAIIGLAL